MTVGVFTNKDKDKKLAVTKELTALLSSLSADFYLFEDLKGCIEYGKFFGYGSEIAFDLMVTVGGDGTILRIVNFCAEKKIPVLGVNLGKLGFLAEIEKKELDVVAVIVSGANFTTEKRTMIEAQTGGKKYSGLNEAVLCRENDGRMIGIKVEINGSFVENFYSDGYIVSTPTGSTAYSLSAGGPILSPSSECFALTAINSHSLNTRPIVINDKESIELTLTRASGGAGLVLDGVKVCAVSENEIVRISKSKVSAEFVKVNSVNFYSKLIKKLNSYSGI